MQDIGKKIKEIRKRKGFSQEELAEAAKVNLRTIQRIENNESEPRGTTLNLICNVLNVNAEDLFEYGKKEDSQYLFFFHLSVLSFILFPLGNVILPLILWLTNKDKIVKLKEIGASTINFQIYWTIISSIGIMLFAYFKLMHYPSANYLWLIIPIMYLINIVFSITYAIKAKRGNYWKYPVPFKIIK